MSKGLVFFGVNNSRVNYLQLAIIAATFARKNLGRDISTCLITDEDTLTSAPANLSQYFDHVVKLETKELFENTRQYKDTRYYTFNDRFRNETRSSVYDLSPYDETLLVDCDYLICSNTLNNVWGSIEDVMINRDAVSLYHDPLNGDEYRLNSYGIRMYWATLIYFRKGDKARELFKLVEHIKENWDFYKLTYDFPGSLFRNDYAFSIAIHILNGGVDDPDNFPSLPCPKILTALDTDQFYKINGPDDLTLFANDKRENWRFTATRVKGLDVHCMNKLSILNNTAEIMEVLK